MAHDFPIKRLECDTFDNRMIPRHVHQARITHQDVEKHIAQLEDWSHNVETFKVFLGEDEDEARG